MIENTLHNDYRFFISYPNEGQVQVYPVNRTLEFIWEREANLGYYRKELKTELVFTNDQRANVNDFDAIYSHDRNLDHCEPLPLQIQRYCGEEWILFFEGELHVVDMSFNPEACRVECPVRPLDQWTCIEETQKIEKNALEVEGSVVPKFIRAPFIRDRGGRYQYQRIYCDTANGCQSAALDEPLTEGLDSQPGPNNQNPGSVTIYPVGGQWALVSHEGRRDPDGFTVKSTLWFREIIETSTKPALGFVCVLGTLGGTCLEYARRPPVALIEENNEEDDFYKINYRPAMFGHIDPPNPRIQREFDYPIRNGKRLNDIIDFMFADCDIEPISDFFQLRPDGTAPDNEFYQIANDKLDNIVVYQKTDAKRPFAEQPATKMPFTIESLFEHLLVMFNVIPFFDESGNFRLEHKSYLPGKYMLDLTQAELKKYLRGKHQYTYDIDELPKQENWRWMDEGSSPDFDGLPITYSGCFTSRDNDTKDFSANYVTTDLLSVRKNPDNFGDDGMVWVACDEDDFIYLDEAILEDNGTVDNYVINAPLSYARLLPNFHTIGRPQRIGRINNEETPLIADPIRDQESIKVKLCCEDISTFDPRDKVKTQLGWGRVEDATLVVPYGSLELNLKHHA